MGYSLFSVGQNVRIVAGSFAGTWGIVAPPASAYQSSGTVLLAAESDKGPVTVAATIDGHAIAGRVPPELLEVAESDPGREAAGRG